jgi:hypothetical protein
MATPSQGTRSCDAAAPAKTRCCVSVAPLKERAGHRGLKPNPRNSVTHSEKQIDELTRIGFWLALPVLVDGNNNTLCSALRQSELGRIPFGSRVEHVNPPKKHGGQTNVSFSYHEYWASASILQHIACESCGIAACLGQSTIPKAIPNSQSFALPSRLFSNCRNCSPGCTFRKPRWKPVVQILALRESESGRSKKKRVFRTNHLSKHNTVVAYGHSFHSFFDRKPYAA